MNLKSIFPAHCKGSRFKPCPWSDIGKRGAPVIGWGVSEKPQGRRAYEPRALEGKVHPFKTEAEAKTACDELNRLAAL